MIDKKFDKNVILVGDFTDKQSAEYIMKSLVQLGCKVAPFHHRKIMKQLGRKNMNKYLLEACGRLKPDLVLVLKGLTLDRQTIKRLSDKYMVVNWMFDVTLGGEYVKDSLTFLDVAEQYDYFFTIAEGSVSNIREEGVNCFWLPEGCFPKENGEQFMNWYQKQKYESDLAFLGTIGYENMHTQRIKVLETIIKKLPSKDIKLYGPLVRQKNIPKCIKDKHTHSHMVNVFHSFVCQSTKIAIGICGWPHVSLSQSARLYRTLCCGGFYLTNHVKNYEYMFNIGKEFDTYVNDEDMINKIKYYLNQEEKRKKIAECGKKLVLEKHTFKHRLRDMLEFIFEDKPLKKPGNFKRKI